jgi:hypothetical protein
VSTAHVDIGYDLIHGIYTALNALVFRECDKITLTGTNGTATIVCSGVSKVASFHTSLTVTASDFVTANAAAYLAVGVVLTSAAGVLTFAGLTVSTRFTGATTIVNATLTLAGTVAASDVVYSVYKTIPKPSAETYVHVHNLMSTDNGTKDDFIYDGTVQIEVVDESKHQGDKKLAYQILALVRALLKPTRTSTFAVTGRTLITFTPGPYGELTEMGDAGLSRLRLIEVYNFLIE